MSRGSLDVCDDCIGDETLGSEIRSEDVVRECSFCYEQRPTKPIGELAPRIFARFRELYRPDRTGSAVDPRGDETRPELGKEPQRCLWEMLGGSIDVVDAIVECLIDNDRKDALGDRIDWADDDTMFVEYEPALEHRRVWQHFAWFAKHRARFFDPRLRSMLDSLFKGMDSFTQPVRLFNVGSSAGSPFFTIYPDDDLALIYRARIARTREEAAKFAGNAAIEVGPPPSSSATPGRMNAGGISVLYGAFAEKTCVAELRLRVGGLAVVARFKVLRPLRLLDFTQFNQRFLNESAFAPDYVNRFSQLAALRLIGDVIARPVQPHEELLDYVPTQILAEYLRDAQGIDGLVYPSAQLGTVKEDAPEKRQGLHPDGRRIRDAERRRQSNVVLFHGASRVESALITADTALHVEDDRVSALALDVEHGEKGTRVVRLNGLDITYEASRMAGD
jgi:hypothetical protein